MLTLIVIVFFCVLQERNIVLSKEPSAEERAAAVVAKAARAAAIAAEEREGSGVSVVTGDEGPAGASPLKLMSADSGACDTIAIWLSKCVFPSKRC
jgi:hypothetical protein